MYSVFYMHLSATKDFFIGHENPNSCIKSNFFFPTYCYIYFKAEQLKTMNILLTTLRLYDYVSINEEVEKIQILFEKIIKNEKKAVISKRAIKVHCLVSRSLYIHIFLKVDCIIHTINVISCKYYCTII